ncbi:Threonine/homoserine efflux transporter RhtA [Amycolatopsis sacchari]|uniref:Threonine/homoserine efflux transporter RhtA n=1 Tax=Amycolatopsis sacchari TaxID=115433 RepID=A0A1I3VKA5_9PSEU|nr:DMT family transporter [Amycolatopsis sacchari]SFJ95620.1 Threonine/homoserine efflux transporter RhtA [Amycolatopsis sacchari]
MERTAAVWGMTTAALAVSASAVVISVSGTAPGTASFWRCLMALPALVPAALWERRRSGAPSRRALLTAAVAGVLFAGDMLLWTQAISEVGAGLSTVLVNLQVVLVPVLAWLVDRERMTRSFFVCAPVMLAGVLCTAGLLDRAPAGADPVWGTVHALLAALCYSGFLFLLRRGGQGAPPVQPYVLVMVAATVASLAAGAWWYGLDLTPAAPALGWLALVALSSQIVGWLLVAVCSPKLSSQLGAVLLLLTPIGSVVLGAVVLGEHPSPWQLVGCALILAGAFRLAVARK